jgi:hypothetical protein
MIAGRYRYPRERLPRAFRRRSWRDHRTINNERQLLFQDHGRVNDGWVEDGWRRAIRDVYGDPRPARAGVGAGSRPRPRDEALGVGRVVVVLELRDLEPAFTQHVDDGVGVQAGGVGNPAKRVYPVAVDLELELQQVHLRSPPRHGSGGRIGALDTGRRIVRREPLGRCDGFEPGP